MSAGYTNMLFGEVCSFDRIACSDKSVPYVGLENIESNTGRLLGTELGDLVKSNTYAFKPGQILYGRLRPYLNKVLMPDFNGQCSTEIFPISVDDEVAIPEYIHKWISSPFIADKINETTTGARMPRANPKDILALSVPIPQIAEQERIVAKLDKAYAAIDQAKANVQRNLQNAKELFQSKLNAVFGSKGDGWVEKKLIEVNRFIDYRGRTPKKTEEGIRLITAKNVRMGYVKQNPEEFIAESDYDDWMTRGIPDKGDVLFTTEAPLANVALLNTDEKIALAQRIITLCPDRSVLTGEFQSYCLQSKEMQDKILAKGTGATVTGIKSKLLKEIQIPIAPLSDQERIVTLLDKLRGFTTDTESKYAYQLNELEDLKKSLLERAFKGEL